MNSLVNPPSPSPRPSVFYLTDNIYTLRPTAEINHLQKKSESQTRDLKKTMKDNAQALAEFEKALIRKSEECNVSAFRWLDE
jgi:CRISPR/Cas system CSM-associated protein Csm4 (group 5 of RAMP superfamily)